MPGQLYLPLDEPRYEYFLFPASRSVSLFDRPREFEAHQRLLADCVRPLAPAEARQLCERGAALASRQPYLSGFDPLYYLTRYPDAADAARDARANAVTHYMTWGFGEGRMPFAFDELFYLRAHPDAAVAIAEGRFRDSLHHYGSVGRARGYATTA
jgi:hypothetical protein